MISSKSVDLLAFVQLPSVSGVDSKLGHHTNQDYTRYASFSEVWMSGDVDDL